MSSKQKLIFLLLIFLFTLFLFSSTVSAWDFNGTILFPNGTRADGVNVTIKDDYPDTGYSNSTLTNANGFFNFTALPDKSYWEITMQIYEAIGDAESYCYGAPFFRSISQNTIMKELSNNTIYLTSTITINVYPYKAAWSRVNYTATTIDDRLATIVNEINSTYILWLGTQGFNMSGFSKARNYTVVFSVLNANTCSPTDPCQVMAYGYKNLSINPYNYFYGTVPVGINHTTDVRGNLTTDANTGNTSVMNFTSMNIFLHVPDASNATLYKTGFFNSTGNETLPNGVNMTTGWFNFSIGNNPRHQQSFIIMGIGNDSAGNWFAGFANITTNTTKTIEPLNINTMRKLAGNYSTGIVNTSKTTFNILNESNMSIQESVSATVSVVYNSTHILWSLHSNTTGAFSLPLLASEPATIKIYHTSYTPKTFELTAEQIRDQSSINLSIAGTDPLTPAGEVLSDINFEFYRSNETCDVPDPPAGCSYGVTYSGKSAYKAMRVPYGDNTSVRLTQSNVTVHFKQIDTTATAAPDAQFDISPVNGTTTGGAFEAVWKLGSLAPSAIYEEVLVGLPYSDEDINDGQAITVNISKLYNTKWQEIWDTAINGTTPATKLSDYADYNTTWFTGMTCDKVQDRINTTQSCYVNTTSNNVWLNIPNFSGIGVDISGTKTIAAAAAAATTSGSASGAGEATTATASFWGEITADSLTSMEVTAPELALTKVEFMLTEDTENARLSVSEPSTQAAAGLGTPSGTVYKYLEITSSNIQADTISSAKIKFKVEKSWLAENNLDKDTVKLNRYADNQWDTLPTRLVSEGPDNINYEAETPGFSYFAISAEKLSIEGIPLEIEEKSLALQLPKDSRVIFGAIFIVALIIIFALWEWETKIVKKRKGKRRKKRK